MRMRLRMRMRMRMMKIEYDLENGLEGMLDHAQIEED